VGGGVYLSTHFLILEQKIAAKQANLYNFDYSFIYGVWASCIMHESKIKSLQIM